MKESLIINKFKKVHGDKYDYSLVNYRNSNTKVEIICRKHGMFKQTPSSHLSGRGCPLCYGTPRKDKNDFLNNCKIVHNNKYDYSLVDYKGAHYKIKIICPIHGEFEQVARSHLRGNGCPKCAGLDKGTNEKFIKISNKIHNNKYDYSLINYKNNKSVIKIICPIHGEFEQRAIDHMSGSGCSKCSKKFRYNKETFILKSKEIHNNKYLYDFVNYKNNKTHVKLICPKHGEFMVRPDNHINSKNGCPVCSESIGERDASLFLIKNNIKYKRYKTFENCKNINVLSFDFYLPDYNTCIEYDGMQHFKPIKYFGGIEYLKLQKIKDQIKNNYCLDNNIQLIRIRYNENIEEKLSFLKEKTQKQRISES